MTQPHDVHVLKSTRQRGGWRVTRAGRTLSRHRTQEEALSVGRIVARQRRVDLVTHARDGRIRSKDSYGNEGATRDTEH